MSDAIVPVIAPPLSGINTEQVRATKPVLASNLHAAAETINWVLGRGRAVVVDGPRTIQNSEAGYGKRFRYWVHGNQYATDYQLMITMSGQFTNGTSSPIYGNIVLPVGGTSYPFAVDGTPASFLLRIPRAYPPTAVSEEISFEFDVDLTTITGSGSGQYLFVHNVHIFESYQIRLGADGANYAGIDTFTLDPKAPIYDGAPYKSIAGLSQFVDSAQASYHRRGCLFSWNSVFMDQALSSPSTTNTSYVDLFAQKPALQSFLTTQGQTTRTAKVNIYAKADNGSGGAGSASVRCTMSNGSTATFTVNTNTFGWRGEQNISVRVDDPSRWVTNGGISVAGRDLMTIEGKVNTSGHRLWLHAVCVHDLPG